MSKKYALQKDEMSDQITTKKARNWFVSFT